MENYLFYEPLRKLKETVESGDIGDVERLPPEDGGERPRRLGRADEQLRVAVPADAATAAGSSCSTTAGTSSPPRSGCSGRSRRCARGSAAPRSCPASSIDAPTTIVWEHENGDPRRVGHHARARHVPALRLLHERRALGGHRPQGLRAGEPLHRPRHPAAEPRGVRRRRDARVPRRSTTTGRSSFRDSGRHWLRWLHTGEGPLLWSGEEAVDVLRFALAAYASSAGGWRRGAPGQGRVMQAWRVHRHGEPGDVFQLDEIPEPTAGRPRGARHAHERMGAGAAGHRAVRRLGDHADVGGRARAARRDHGAWLVSGAGGDAVRVGPGRCGRGDRRRHRSAPSSSAQRVAAVCIQPFGSLAPVVSRASRPCSRCPTRCRTRTPPRS